MALIGNRSVLHKSPGRFLNGFGTAGGGIATLRSNFSKHGMMRNAYQAYDPLSATPDGHLSPSAWVLPKTGGGMSSVNFSKLAFTAAGAGAEGINIEGTAALALSFAPAAGQLISSGSGSASFAISPEGSILASLSGIGSASFSFSTNAPLLGALGWVVGTGAFSVGAGLTSYAVGNMSGSTVDNSVLTVDAIAAGVLAAALTSPIAADIKKVNAITVNGTGSPGTPWGP